MLAGRLGLNFKQLGRIKRDRERKAGEDKQCREAGKGNRSRGRQLNAAM